MICTTTTHESSLPTVPLVDGLANPAIRSLGRPCILPMVMASCFQPPDRPWAVRIASPAAGLPRLSSITANSMSFPHHIQLALGANHMPALRATRTTTAGMSERIAHVGIATVHGTTREIGPGIDQEIARGIALETVQGTAHVCTEEGTHYPNPTSICPERLRPNGTTKPRSR